MNTSLPLDAHDTARGTFSAPDGIQLEIHDSQGHLAIDHERIAAWARETLALEGVSRATISVAVVDDSTIHALNARFLDHDWPTDVITFPLSDPADSELAGEIVISAETAVRTAAATHGDGLAELALYLIHGLLHLCGFDDQTPEDFARMHARQAWILERLPLKPCVAPAVVDETPIREEGDSQWTV